MVLFFVGEVLEVHTDDGGLSKQEGVCLYVCMRERQRERERERERERDREREAGRERDTERGSGNMFLGKRKLYCLPSEMT